MKQISNDVSLDVENGYIITDGKRIALTRRETQVAECLLEKPINVEEICKKCKLSVTNVRVIIHRMRRKIEGVVKTKINFGYFVD